MDIAALLESLQLNLPRKILEAAEHSLVEVRPVWEGIDEVVLANQAKVLRAFIEEKVGAPHLSSSTGYGYGDFGRDTMDRVFARAMGAEAALVRPHWASGTHVLKTALFSLLRPGDEMLCVTGTPYETMVPVIGIAASGERPAAGSLADFGVLYRENRCLLDLQEGTATLKDVEKGLDESVTPRTKVLYIQRSRGYTSRQSISMETLTSFMDLKTRKWPNLLTIVDNCYCEFVEREEPPSVGVSISAGSLIKNPGGGLAPTGGYVAGNAECVGRVAEALYAPGLGGEVGSNPHGYRDTYQGLFLAPKVVGEALKGASFAASLFNYLGFRVNPGPADPRSDIVQAITLGTPERLKALCAAVQEWSPVDSFAAPEPWDMPGYQHQVIMAAGTFVQGSSIELSCDAPFTPPYTAYLQGGLTKEHVILACLRAAAEIAGE